MATRPLTNAVQARGWQARESGPAAARDDCQAGGGQSVQVAGDPAAQPVEYLHSMLKPDDHGRRHLTTLR